MTERYDRQNAGFDTTSPSPFKAPGLNLKGGLLFTSASNRLPYQSNLANVQPRVGVAYQINSKTVFRGGYGLVYQPMFEAGTNNGFSVSTAYVASNDGGITPANHLYNPFPARISFSLRAAARAWRR
jgi:hypothetical protein